MVIPLTTPNAKVSEKTFTQKLYACIHAFSPVELKRNLKYSSTHASEMLMAGKRM